MVEVPRCGKWLDSNTTGVGVPAEEEQEMVVDHFEMQKAGPDELIFAQNEVGDCVVLSCPWELASRDRNS